MALDMVASCLFDNFENKTLSHDLIPKQSIRENGPVLNEAHVVKRV
jgi:hypothetical protein